MSVETRLLQAAHRFVPPGVQSIAMRPVTHQIVNVLLVGMLSLYIMLMAQPGFLGGAMQGQWAPILGLLMLLSTALAGGLFCLRHFERNLASAIRSLYLLSLILVCTMAAEWLLGSLGLHRYLSPLVACAMLLTIFVNARVAMALTLLLGLLVGVFPRETPTSVLVAILGSVVAIYAVSRVSQRSDLARAGFVAGAFNAWMVASFSLMANRSYPLWWQDAAFALASGVGCAVLVVGLLPFIESMFSITTTFKLLELSNPSQPLLRELLLKAPGTYHHSILVGNLAEAAAEAIGADALLVRVGAYYHDIGKTKRPYFFIENQMGMSNQHDRISPRLSALVIAAHVKEGLEMAREHKLPQVLQDFIATHHGTSLISFFYQQALQSEGKQVLEEHFRYPGPRPRTRETGIVMLADGVEASCRSISKPTMEQLENMVRKIVDKRLADGELSETPLTLKEIETITGAFLRVLQGLFHNRIEYPDQVFKELRAGEGDFRARRAGGAR